MAGRTQDAAKRRAFLGGVLPQQQRSGSVTLSAPVGGINTSSPAGAMAATDCLSLDNMISYQYGLRVRAGFTDWFTGLQRSNEFTGVEEFEKVRTLLPFSGSSEDGANDRLFACTKSGIYDVTGKSTDLTAFWDVSDAVYVFTNTTYYAGSGVATAFTNSAGEHFLAYCDGANGYILYRESTDTWEKILQSPNVAWVPGTAYVAGDKIVNQGLAYSCVTGGTSTAKWLPLTVYAIGDLRVNGLGLYKCTSAGTSAAAGGPTGVQAGEVDGTVTWEFVSLSGPLGVGSAVTEGTVTWDFYPTIAGANPTTFRHVMQWKNRLWFVPGNSQNAYYLEVGTYAGQAHKMIFSPRFRYGGDLVGLWSWTLDGGQGVDDLLVAISRGGDIAVYQGTNPAYAETFGLRGVWWVGPVPPGRTVASDFGGDLFILSRMGCIPLSRLVAGGLIRDPNIYETAKVSNLFNQLMSERGGREGWAMTQHPDDNLIIINVPGTAGHSPEQLVMSLATKGWSRHTGVPIECMGTWHGKLYFGTADGRVCVSEGHLDSGVEAEEHVTGEGTTWDYKDNGVQPIPFSLLSAYSNLGNANKKRVHMARPYFITDGTPPPYSIQARYDYDLSTNSITPPTATVPANAWDHGLWDAALWSAAAGTAGVQWGTVGMGTVVAVALRGTSISLTTLVSIDVMIDHGWLL